jgi:tetratricopeptide (TPR) repeat protein
MAALVLGLVLACYWPALNGGLIWDDAAHVTPPELRSWAGLGRIWAEVGATQQYYPVLHSAFWVEHRLWGDATLGYHLVNVLLHATACCLLALVLQRLWRPDPGIAKPPSAQGIAGIPPEAGWLAALIFAVHPVCVESVAWISEQKNTMSLVFYLLAGFVYLDFDARRRWRSYGLALGFFLLALATKSVTATLPAAILVVLWWRNGRLSWRRDAGPLAPWFLVALASGLFTTWVERKFVGAEGAPFDLSAGQRLLLAGRVIWFYLGKLAWPADLMFIYPRWDVSAGRAVWAVCLGGAVAVTAALWLIRRRARGPLAGWLFFTGSLFPALGFFNVFPFLYSYVADHFQYLAGVGAIAAAAGGGCALLARATPRIRAAGHVLFALLVIALGILANLQSRTYRDGETLYRATLAHNPGCWMAHNNLATELAKSPAGVPEALQHYEQALRLKPGYAEVHYNLAAELAKLPGRLSESIAHYEEAVRIRPGYAEAHNNLAVELARSPGRMTEAVAHFEEALRIHPDYAEAHSNLANVLARLPGRMPEALAHYEEALRFRPDFTEVHVNLGNVLAELPGRVPDALAHYEQALRIRPDLVDVHIGMANLLAEQPGRMPEALAHFERALQIRPDYPEAHNDLANELAKLPGRAPEALAHYEQALRIKPDYAEVHFNLANVLAGLPGRIQEALDHYEEALRLKPDYLAAHDSLGLVLARQGRFAEARKHWEQALKLDPGDDDARRNLGILDKLQER